MRKIKKRLFGLCLGFVLTLGVGVGLGGTHKEAIGIKATGSVNVAFGNTNVKVDSTNFKFTDSAGTNWTIVTEGSGVSIQNQGGTSQWTQFGSKNNPATSITLTGMFKDSQQYNITNFSTKWGGSSDTAGTIVAKVGNTQIASGSLSGDSEVTISQASSSSISGENLTISVTNISKGVKLYSLSYSYEESSSGETYTVSFDGNGAEGTMVDVTAAGGSYALPESTFTAPSGKVFAGWKANNEGNLLATGDKYTLSADTTFYAQWANSYSVAFTAGDNGTGSYVASNQPEGTYTLPAFEDLTGISANTGYQFNNYSVNGETKNPGDEITLSNDISIDVIFGIESLKTTYDFTTKFSTYAKSWSSYDTHEGLNGKTDIGGDYNATIHLYYASKQNSTITNMPVFATKTDSGSWKKVLQFTLTETGYKIDNITVTFAQWSDKTPSISLYKGTEVSGTALDTAKIGTKNTLTASNFNGTTFSVGYSDGSTSNRVQSGLKSIYIEMSAANTFGTLDHISIAQAPSKTVYHVGETFDSTGLSVMAYDGADEDTANFKDVTSEVEMLLDNTYEFVKNDVPGMDEEVTYEGKTATFHVYVYDVGEYNLVTKNLNNWSGKYLIVGVEQNSDSKTVAMDSYLSAPDSANNYKVVDESNSTIKSGKELEWTISKMDGGYSIKGQSGKYIGSFETTKDSGLVANDTALLNTISINGTSGEATIKGTNGYSLKFNNTSSADRFRYYSGGTVKLYRLADSEDALLDAEIFAETFNAQIGCDPNGLSEPEGWEVVKADWEFTNVEAQIILSNVDLSTETNEEIKNCITTYEYIINKYNQSNPTKYNDFMGRNLVSAKANVVYQTNNNDTPILIVVLVSFVSVTAIGGYVFLRKRKVN